MYISSVIRSRGNEIFPLPVKIKLGVPRLLEPLRKVGDDVVYVLDADADSDHVLRPPAAVLLSLHDVVSRAQSTNFEKQKDLKQYD